jgi:hypothetical protein
MSTAIDTMTDTTPALTPALRRFVGEKGFALFHPGGDLVAVTDGHVAVVYDRAGLELAGVLRAVGADPLEHLRGRAYDLLRVVRSANADLAAPGGATLAITARMTGDPEVAAQVAADLRERAADYLSRNPPTRLPRTEKGRARAAAMAERKLERSKAAAEREIRDRNAPGFHALAVRDASRRAKHGGKRSATDARLVTQALRLLGAKQGVLELPADVWSAGRIEGPRGAFALIMPFRID